MEAVSSNLDCNTLSALSRVSKFSSKPTSKLLFSCPLSRSNSRKKRNLGLKIAGCLDQKRVVSEAKNGFLVAVNGDLVKRVGRVVLGFAAAVSLCCDSPAFAESLTVAFPVSHTREVNTVQRTLVEAWGLIRETFIDPTFNHQGKKRKRLDLKLQQTMVEMFPLRSEDAAYNKIKGMLSTLGDPFTRIISPKEYQSFRIGSDGNLQGVGLFVNVEPKTGHLVVLSCIENSPAARAGIHKGDELMEINGERLDGVASEAAAQKLRGRVGTTVTVKVHSSVTELHDGSALFVTVAKYLSPALHDIDQVGITPDVQCTTDFLNSPKDSFRNGSSDSSLESDSCILVAEHQLDVQESKGSAS
ncbi:UNVERIFIED_CONTAM: Carboxyl-terminal-processing peptidase 3, chloroplastic [Sesamum radiatum]|uniref:C-terminal processing peptidase n=1 Tax=Sesamum radiatum TaxID=300843 RepID=A0AAW2TJY8_SESRA